MTTMRFIRKTVFGGSLTQAEFGALAGATQATVSRWEAGELNPTLDQLRRVRAEAQRRKLAWHDSFFFEAPLAEPCSHSEAAA